MLTLLAECYLFLPDGSPPLSMYFCENEITTTFIIHSILQRSVDALRCDGQMRRHRRVRPFLDCTLSDLHWLEYGARSAVFCRFHSPDSCAILIERDDKHGCCVRCIVSMCFALSVPMPMGEVKQHAKCGGSPCLCLPQRKLHTEFEHFWTMLRDGNLLPNLKMQKTSPTLLDCWIMSNQYFCWPVHNIAWRYPAVPSWAPAFLEAGCIWAVGKMSTLLSGTWCRKLCWIFGDIGSHLVCREIFNAKPLLPQAHGPMSLSHGWMIL